MVFSSTTFLFVFLPMVLLGHTLLRTTAGRNVFLLITSLLFYAWGEGPFVLVMLAAILVNHFAALWIARAPDARYPKAAHDLIRLLATSACWWCLNTPILSLIT